MTTKNPFWPSLALAITLMPVGSNAENTMPTSPTEQFSYALGYQIGTQIARQMMTEGLDLDPGYLAQAIEDVLSGATPAITQAEMDAAITAIQQQSQEKSMEKVKAAEQAGQEFRQTYQSQEGVSETESGILYRVLTPGTGSQPKIDDTVVVHYRGTLVDGTEFDSSIRRGQPATFSLGGIIPGWQEALQLMNEGARWEVVIPPELAYGETGAGGAIGPQETLIFEIELIEVK
jgi:FKBP-type peptidyl-prolyl cis-trans isomerase FklB|tara:strand:- start:1075 stop:1773 length:699 start_codon:yes stop_codon:yes gene_type:complete